VVIQTTTKFQNTVHNDNFYNTTIIKQNNMTYKHKVVFYIRDGFEYEFGMDTYIPVTRPIPAF